MIEPLRRLVVYVRPQLAAQAMAARVDALPPARLLAGGHGQGCIVAEDDSVWCWGPLNFDLDWGVQGNPPIVPKRVEGLPRLTELAGGLHFMCGAAEDGSVWCWEATTMANSALATRKRTPHPCEPCLWAVSHDDVVSSSIVASDGL